MEECQLLFDGTGILPYEARLPMQDASKTKAQLIEELRHLCAEAGVV